MQPPGGWGPPPGGYGVPPGGAYGPPGGGYGPPGAAPPPYGSPPGWGPPPGGPPRAKSHVGLVLGILVGFVVLCFGGCVLCIALAPPPDPKEEAKRVAERKATIEEGTKRFLALKAAFPAKPAEKACPDEKIPKGSVDLGHHAVDYDFLERFANPALDIETGALKDFDYLTSSTLRGMDPPGKITDFATYSAVEAARRFDDVSKGKVVIVVRATRRVLPRDSGGEAFEGGEFEGWAVVFDLAAGSPLCAARVVAESSDEVTHRDRGILKETLDEALRKDFKKQVEKSLDAALGRISRNLRRSPY